MGVIIRTAGVGRTAEELADLDYLLKLWAAISEAADENAPLTLLYQESDVIIRAIRDYLKDDIDQVLIDEPHAHRQALDFVSMVMPKYQNRIKAGNDGLLCSIDSRSRVNRDSFPTRSQTSLAALS